MIIIIIIFFFSVPAYCDMLKLEDLIADVVTQVADISFVGAEVQEVKRKRDEDSMTTLVALEAAATKQRQCRPKKI